MVQLCKEKIFNYIKFNIKGRGVKINSEIILVSRKGTVIKDKV